MSYKNRLAIGIIDNGNSLENSFKTISCNLADGIILEAYINDYEVFIGPSADDLLEQANSAECDAILIVSLGSYFSPLFWPLIKNLFTKIIKNNIALVGHLLDRFDSYYELHEQNFLVNLNWWRQSKPKVGDVGDSIGYIGEPERSVENYHDNYTPLWVKATNNKKVFIGKSFYGYNIINQALATGHKIETFSSEIRNEKLYIYPKEKNLIKLYKIISTIAKNENIVYVNSSENLFYTAKEYVINNSAPSDNLVNKNIDCVFTPASGTMPLMFSFIFNLTGKIVIYDYNIESVNFIKSVLQAYKGELNWKDLVSDFVEKHNIVYDKSTYNKSQNTLETLINLGYSEYIPTFLSLQKSYHTVDLFNIERFLEIFRNETEDYNNIFLHVSNIYHFEKTSVKWSWDERLKFRNLLLNALQKLNKNIYINFNGNKIDSLSNVINISMLPNQLDKISFIGPEKDPKLHNIYLKRSWIQKLS